MMEEEAVEGIYTGSLANKIKKDMRYVLTGLAIGGFIGFFTASLTGQSKLLFVFAGAGIGAAIGKYTSPKPEKSGANESE